MKIRQKKIPVLVTGGAGFIGSHVADILKKDGYQVYVLDDLSGGFKNNVAEGITFIEGSVTDNRLVERIFKKYKFEYVFHLAAYAAEGLSHFIRRFNYENNVIGSINLINASVNNTVRCFVFTSSIAVYGKNQLPMREDLVPQPEDPYGIAKYSIELDLKAAHEMFGLNYVIFRPHNVYGERQNIADKYRNVIGIFMNKAMKGEPMPIFGDGKQQRAFSHIDDVAPLIARSISKKRVYNQVFNIGADIPYSVNTLAKVVSSAMGVSLQVVHHPVRKEVKNAYADHSKITQFFGDVAKIDLETGVSRMAEWAKKFGAMKGKVFSKIEIEKNLPLSWKK